MKDRIREIRKLENLSMDGFGKRLSISRTAVSYLESGKNIPSAQTISLICKEFGIRREWLLTGEGEMKAEADFTDELFRWAGQTLKDEDSFRTDFLRMLMALDQSDWDVIEKMVKTLLKAQQEREAKEHPEEN